MANNDLLIRIGARLDGLEKGLDKGLKSIKQFGFKAERIGSQLSTRVSAPILAIGAASVTTFAKFDKLEKGLSAITGSATEGARQLDAYLNVVKDTRTTLDLQTAVGAALKLQAVGLAAQESERVIRQLGIAATVSGSSIEDVGGVVRQFSQIIGKGKIEQEDLNSILDRMPALASVIRKEFGAATAEEIRDTGISMETFVSRLTTAIEKNENFQNVQGGISKALETFGIELQIAGKTLGETIAKTLKLEERIASLSAFIGRAVERFSQLNPSLQKFIIVSATAAAAVGPLTFGLGAVAKSIPLLTSGFGLLTGPIKTAIGFLSKFGLSVVSAFSGFAKAGAVSKAVIIGGSLTKAITAIKVAFAALTGPVGLVVGAIVLIGAAFTRAYNRSETFRKAFAPIIDLFKRVGGSIVSLVGGAFSSFTGALGGMGGIVDVVLASVAAFGAGLVKFIQEPIKFIQTQVQALAQALSGDFRGALKTFGSSFTNFGKETATTFANVFNETIAGPEGLKVPGVATVGPEIPQSPQAVTGGGKKELTFFQELAKQLDIVKNKSAVLGDSYNATAAKAELLRNALYDSLEEGFKPTSDRIVRISGELQDLQSSITATAVAAINNKLDGSFGLNQFVLRVSDAQAASKALETQFASLKANAPNENLFIGLNESFDVINNKSIIFADSFDVIGAKIEATRSALVTALEEGFSPYSTEIELLQEKLSGLTEAQQALIEKQESLKESLQLIGDVAGSAFDAVANAMAQGANAAQAFSRAVVGAIRQAIAAEIKLAVVAAARKALISIPFPLNVAGAAIAGAGASALFSGLLNKVGIPALAKGAMVDQPTLALIGEAGPEVVVPLDRLREFQSGGGGSNVNVSGVLRASGSELLALITSAQRAQNRSF